MRRSVVGRLDRGNLALICRFVGWCGRLLRVEVLVGPAGFGWLVTRQRKVKAMSPVFDQSRRR